MLIHVIGDFNWNDNIILRTSLRLKYFIHRITCEVTAESSLNTTSWFVAAELLFSRSLRDAGSNSSKVLSFPGFTKLRSLWTLLSLKKYKRGLGLLLFHLSITSAWKANGCTGIGCVLGVMDFWFLPSYSDRDSIHSNQVSSSSSFLKTDEVHCLQLLFPITNVSSNGLKICSPKMKSKMRLSAS